MPPSSAVIARDQRILAGHAAGATILELASAEEVDPAVVRRVLRAAGVTPGPLSKRGSKLASDCLSDSAWLTAKYATKGAVQIAKELRCSPRRVYEALHAAGIPVHKNGHHRPAAEKITPEVADRIVSLYLAGWTADRVAGEFALPVDLVSSLIQERGVKRSRSEAALLRHAEGRPGPAKQVPIKPRGEWAPELEDEVVRRYGAGETGATIADSLGLAPASVYRLLKDRGVTRSRSEGKKLWHEQRQAAGKPLPGKAAEWPPQVTAQVLERYAAGEPAQAIAKTLRVGARRVYKLLRDRGVLRSMREVARLARAARGSGRVVEQPTKHREEWTAALETEILERYTAGESASAIAKELSLSRWHVGELLRERGVAVRTISQARRLQEEQRASSGYSAKRDQPLPAEVVAEVV